MASVIATRIADQRQRQDDNFDIVGARKANNPKSKLPSQTGYADGAPRMSMQGFGVIVGLEAKVALYMNVNRGYLYIQNNSSDDLYLSFDAKPNPKSALVIGAGGYFEPRVCPTNAVWLLSASLTNAQVNVVEGVLR